MHYALNQSVGELAQILHGETESHAVAAVHDQAKANPQPGDVDALDGVAQQYETEHDAAEQHQDHTEHIPCAVTHQHAALHKTLYGHHENPYGYDIHEHDGHLRHRNEEHPYTGNQLQNAQEQAPAPAGI